MMDHSDPADDAEDRLRKPRTDNEGRLTLRLRPIDAVSKGPPTPSVAAAAESAELKTLTTFDWLDTIVDEVVVASDKLVRHPAPTVREAEASASQMADAATMPARLDAAAVLGQVVLGYAPIIDRRQGVIATRLTIVPVRADAVLDAGALLEAVGDVWPIGSGSVLLNVSSESLLEDLLRARPNLNVMIEVPAFIAADPLNLLALRELASRGNTLILKGRPVQQLPRAALPCFKWSIVDFAEDRRIGAAMQAPAAGIERTIPHIQAGVRTMAQLRLSFDRGAIAVIGWPLHEPLAPHLEARPDLQVVLEMISRIDRNEAAAAVHRPLLRDPVLAYELVRHVSAATSGPLQLETGSLGQAISLVGHQQLRRWLAGILERTGDQVSLRPVNFAALRRGLLMRLLASADSDAQTRGELFMCGVFSLLDRIFSRPTGELLSVLAIPDRVAQALVEHRGPFVPLLDLARAIESGVPHDIRTASDAVFVAPAEINRALLRTLRVASDLERGER